jgi:hypothetical protein
MFEYYYMVSYRDIILLLLIKNSNIFYFTKENGTTYAHAELSVEVH